MSTLYLPNATLRRHEKANYNFFANHKIISSEPQYLCISKYVFFSIMHIFSISYVIFLLDNLIRNYILCCRNRKNKLKNKVLSRYLLFFWLINDLFATQPNVLSKYIYFFHNIFDKYKFREFECLIQLSLEDTQVTQTAPHNILYECRKRMEIKLKFNLLNISITWRFLLLFLSKLQRCAYRFKQCAGLNSENVKPLHC